MTKKVTVERKKETVEEKGSPKGSEKVVETTKKSVVENLDAHKLRAQEKQLEKEKARLENIEHTAEAAEKKIDEQIEEKKAQLAELEPVVETKEVKVVEKSEKKKGNIDRNPLNRVRHIGTRALSGVVAFPSRVAAKVNHIYARPQQLVSGGFWKDLGKNILKTPGAILTTISGAVYRPHRDKVKFEDNFQDYGPEFANPTDKNWVVRNGKKALRLGGKVITPTLTAGTFGLLPKFFANVGRGMNHAIHETFEGIRDSKWHWNPTKWNLRPWKFSKTLESFGKAFSRNKKGKGHLTAHVSHKEHKKAA